MLAKLNLSLVLWAAASLVLAAAVPANSSGNSSLLLGPINFAGYDNYLYRDDKTAAQIVLSSNASNSKPSRFLVAFPEGNTGVVAYFIPSNASSSSGNSSNSNSTSKPLKLSLDPKSLSTVSGANNQMGLSGTLNLTSDVSLGVVLIGSVRTLRDFTEGSGLTHEIFNYTLGSYSNSSVQFVRHWINGTTVQYLTFNATDNLNISVSPSSNITLPPNITMKRLDGSKNGSLKFSTTFNFTEKPTTQGQGLGPSSLFLDSAPATGSAGLQKVLKAIQGGGNSSSSGTFGERVNEISFLTYQDKFLAGGWRFLTCRSHFPLYSFFSVSARPLCCDCDFIYLICTLSPPSPLFRFRTRHLTRSSSPTPDHDLRSLRIRSRCRPGATQHDRSHLPRRNDR